jgi:hypothetical protein
MRWRLYVALNTFVQPFVETLNDFNH